MKESFFLSFSLKRIGWWNQFPCSIPNECIKFFTHGLMPLRMFESLVFQRVNGEMNMLL